MSSVIEIFMQYGFELARALTLLLAVGALAVRISGSPVRRHTLVEWTLGIALLAAALADSKTAFE
jgi:hypothetical protein